jgi:ATP-dependent RNA helicase DeaD
MLHNETSVDETDEATDEETSETPDTAARTDYKSGKKFDEFPLSDELLQGLAEMGYGEATQVQALSIEPGLAGRDMLVRAKTGTGKTTAFGIPIVERVEEGSRYVQALVLSPTRELANQIARELAGLAKFKDLRILPIYGGVGMGPQEQALEEGVEIVVGTPGRVADHIRRGNLDLSRLKVSCLDEADEMLSMGFYKDVTGILKKAPKESQTLLFSATVEAEVKRIVSQFLDDPEDIILSTDTDRVEGITHVLYESSPNFHKARALLAVIDTESPGSTIIFCNTREDTNTVATFLDRQGLDAQLISGELPQKKREQVMAKVKSGEVQFLVATDVAARGIDISNLTHVINYALPGDPAVYMHRIGRTGRIGKEGMAITLAGGGDLSTRMVLEKQFKIAFEYREMPTPEEAGQLRVERQVATIKAAAGTTAFEAFLPMVRAMKDRPDGDVLLATAMKGFFLWDRARRADTGVDTVGAIQEARSEKRETGGRGGGRGRSGGRDGGGRGGRDGDRRGGRDGDRRRDERPRARSDRSSEQAASPSPRDSESAPASTGSSSSEGGEPKRRRRRRRS